MAAMKKQLPMRDARGRFIARPMFRIGEYRIGVDAPDACTAPAIRRRPSNMLRMFMVLVQFVVALFALKSVRGRSIPSASGALS